MILLCLSSWDGEITQERVGLHTQPHSLQYHWRCNRIQHCMTPADSQRVHRFHLAWLVPQTNPPPPYENKPCLWRTEGLLCPWAALWPTVDSIQLAAAGRSVYRERAACSGARRRSVWSVHSEEAWCTGSQCRSCCTHPPSEAAATRPSVPTCREDNDEQNQIPVNYIIPAGPYL